MRRSRRAAATRRRVVIIGPGKLGCGYLAPLFADAGWSPTLVARTARRARRIRRAGAFHVQVTTGVSSALTCSVTPFGRRSFDAAIASADLVLTSVGVEKVASLGDSLARALARRPHTSPLDVCVVENADVAPVLERAVHAVADAKRLALPPVGFAGAIAYPVVARGDWDGGTSPTFVRDGVDRLLIDTTRLVRDLPEIPGLVGTSDYPARLREKLYVFSAGHALCAYLGACCGYERLDEAIRDPLVRSTVRTCLLEARLALEREYEALDGDGCASVYRALERYENRELRDTIRRVARCPVRKLGPGGPLVGAAMLARLVLGRIPPPFALGIASALLYHDEADVQSWKLQQMLRRHGPATVVREVCKLEPGDPFFRSVLVAYERMRRGGGRPRLAAP
jgi:mannitol-1-phosphate 5-dehydrogenase